VLALGLFAALQACGEGPPSGYVVPPPSTQTPTVCTGTLRNIATAYPASTSGSSALASIQLQEGRDPVSTLIAWSVQSTATPSNATDMILRSSTDTSLVIMTVTRVIVLGANPTYSFVNNATALNGTVDIDTAYNIIQAGAVEIVFRSSGNTITGGKIPLTTGAQNDWVPRTC
jgi:hypothetical protein